MGDSVLSAASFVLDGLIGLGIAALALDGARQVTTGGPGFLPFERLLRKRVPATDTDWVRHGAAELLQALALTFIAGPLVVQGLILTGNLTGSSHPVLVRTALFAGAVASLIVGMVLVIAAYNLSNKVSYVPTSTGAHRTSS